LSIDGLDRKILNALEHDARRSFRELAVHLGVSPSTIAARVQNLEMARIIRGYSALLNHSQLGFDLTAITEIVVSKGKLLEMEKEIAKLKGVCAVYDITGEADGLVIAKFRNREELSQFTKTMLALPFIERTNTHVVLTTVREDFRLPLE
jgi:DNA-binding Lrp family transcriptional regulator